jgi:DNA-binding MarR family transcriptional regulator
MLARMSAAAQSEAGPPAGPRPACGGALSDDLGWALGVVFRSYAKAANLAFSELPGGQRGYQVLAAAALGETRSQLELAQHLGVDRTVMTYLLDDLECTGLIERRADPADRRARRVVATAPGRERLDELDRRLRAAEEQVLAGLAAGEDRQAFRYLLRKLALHADTLDPVRGGCQVATDVAAP